MNECNFIYEHKYVCLEHSGYNKILKVTITTGHEQY